MRVRVEPRIKTLYLKTISTLHPIHEKHLRMRVVASFSALPDRRKAAQCLSGDTMVEWLLIKSLEV